MCSGFLVLQGSFLDGSVGGGGLRLLPPQFKASVLFTNWKQNCCWSFFPPSFAAQLPTPSNKSGILAFPRISVHHQCFWRQLKAFFMETFTHPGKVPRPQDSAKPLMMIERASSLRWKHAESLTLECAARLHWGGGGRRLQDLGVEVPNGTH